MLNVTGRGRKSRTTTKRQPEKKTEGKREEGKGRGEWNKGSETKREEGEKGGGGEKGENSGKKKGGEETRVGTKRESKSPSSEDKFQPHFITKYLFYRHKLFFRAKVSCTEALL